MNRLQKCAIGASILLGSCDAAAFGAGRFSNALYAEEPLWIVAQYSFPWALGSAMLATGLAIGWLVYAAFVRKLSLQSWLLSGTVAAAASSAVCAEAGMGIYYQQVTGEFRITELVFSRTALQFPSSQDGVCLHAELRSSFVWSLNGTLVHPRLLPLPLDDERLRARLLAPGACP